MDYEGTRDPASELPMGEIALGQSAPNPIAAAAGQAGAGAMVLVADANNTVVLPDGATLDDIHVRGRDLIVETGDGRIFVIPEGAVFVPQIVAQGVTVPPLNLAALLIGQEPTPEAGPVRSSGGNFEVAVDPLQDAYKLGNLLPYTELQFPEPRQEEIFAAANAKPGVIVFTPDNPAGAVNATDQVREAGLPERNDGEPEGTDAASNSETTTGTIRIDSPDGIASITINGTPITAVGQTIVTANGVLTITSIAPGSYGYSYTLTDNTAGNDTSDPFTVTVTDTDGDSATGTLTIDIVNDRPIPRADTDSVAAGTFGPESGNVLSGSGTTSGSAGRDTVGADDATLTGVRAGNSGDFVAPGGEPLVGQYGTLNLNGDGSYTYTRNPGTPGGVSDVFSYQLTDGDGDTDTATLTIDIGDLAPVTGENAVVQLDDDALTGGNPGGDGDDVDAANVTGTLSGSGGDGALTFALAASGAPAGFTYQANGTGLDVFQGETLVLHIALDPASGNYTVTQLAPIVHAAGEAENNQAFTLNYTVSDVDGDATAGTLTIDVDDDSPTVTAQGEVASLTVDESTLVATASADFSGLFSHSYGADGAGTITYALGVAAGLSGLVDTLSGESVTLSIGSGGVVEGRTALGGLLVFTVSVDAGGSVTLSQSRAVIHDPNAGPNDVETLLSSLVTLTQTVTDSDGDPASASATIGHLLSFVDDAPTASNDSDSIPSGSYGPATGNVITDTAAGDAGDGDNGADRPGNDGAAVTAITGFDGEGEVAGTVGGTTAGRYGVLELNADGSYTYTRNPGTPGGVSETFTYTLTDGDGDTAQAQLVIDIADALPVTAPNALVQLDDDALAGGNPGGSDDDVDAANVTGTLAASGGDGPLSWALVTGGAPSGFTYVETPAGLNVKQGATVVLKITVDPATGAYTVTQVAPIQHPDGEAENNVAFTVNYTVTDQDGDSAPGTLTINVDDDTPTVTAAASGNVALNDESATASTAATLGVTNIGDDPHVAGAGAISRAVSDGAVVIVGGGFGADGAATDNALTYALTVTNRVSGLKLTDGSAINLVLEGNVIVGRVVSGANVRDAAFAISIDPATGVVTVEQYLSLQHPDTGNPDDQVALALGSLGVTVTRTDGDGDSASASADISAQIRFDDDGPTANDDSDLITGGATTATGNVITDVEGDGGKDLAGADGGAAVVAITGFGGAGTVGGTTHGEFGDLVLGADGSYTYTRNPGAPGDAMDVFTYTLTDGDGDTDTATLTITIADGIPVTTPNPIVLLDDDVFEGGNPGGVEDNADAANTSGTLSGAGGNGALTWAFQLPANGGGFTYEANGTGIDIKQGGTLVLQVTLNPATGAYTVTQLAPIDHAAGGDENNQLFTLSYTVSDVDGDSAGGTLTIDVDDDTPTVTAGGEAPSLSVDETNLVATDSQDLSGLFSHSAGADGLGSIAYGLGIVAGPSGLVDTLSGEAVILSMNGGVVEGRTATGNLLVFTVGVDAGGLVTLTQDRAVVHTPDGGPNDVVALASGLVTLTQTVTDGDGDSAAATTAIGGLLNFVDDAPSLAASGEQPQLTVDETVLATDASASFAGVFVPSYGADGAGSVSNFVLGINPGATGLVDVASGQAVNLVMNGTTVEGRTATGNDLVFTVSVAADGTVTLDQIRALAHPDTANPDDPVTLSADNLITLTATVTDGDGDTNTATATIGQNLTFLDDGPSVTATGTVPVLTVDETNLAVNAGPVSFAGIFGISYGADNAGTTAYALSINTSIASGLIDTATNQAVILSVAGNVVTGRAGALGPVVFTLTLAANGDLTLDQQRAVAHSVDGGPGAAHDDPATLAAGAITLTATVTDRDNDSVSAAVQIGTSLVFKDDGPSLAATGTQPQLTVDETVLATDANASFAGVFVPTYGADGTGTVGNFVLGISAPNAASGLIDVASGQAVNLVMNGTTVEGRTTGSNLLVFTLSVNGAGSVTLDQIRALSHPNAANPNDPVTLSADNLITLTATVTDGDGDTNTATANIGQNLTFLDDGPSAFTPVTATLVNIAGPVSAPIALSFAAAAGADHAANAVFNVVNGTPLLDTLGRTMQFGGEKLFLQNLAGSAGHVIEARTADGDLAFTATLNPAGDNYTIDLEGSIYNVDLFSFSAVTSTVGGGNINYKGLGIGTGGAKDILISGNGSVNTNNDDIGIGSGNDVGSGDVARFDMVSNLAVQAVGPANGNTGFTHTGHYEVANFIQAINFVQGGGTNTSGFTVTIRNGDSDFTYLGDATGETPPPDITVRVFNGNPNAGGTLVATFTDTDNSVAVTGVRQGYYVQISSSDPFAIVEYSTQTGRPFKLGAIQIETANTLDPFSFQLPVTGIDGDGDSVNSNIQINLNPPPPPPVPAEPLSLKASSETTVTFAERIKPASSGASGTSAAASGLIAALAIDHAAPAPLDDPARATLAPAAEDRPAALEAATDKDASGEPQSAAPAAALSATPEPVSAHRDMAAAHDARIEQLDERLAETRGEGGGVNARSALFESHGQAIMDALLAQGAAPAPKAAAVSAPAAIAAALADSAAAQAVDSIVKHFAGAGTAAPEAAGHGAPFDLTSLLHIAVNGGGEPAAMAFVPPLPIDHEHAAATV